MVCHLLATLTSASPVNFTKNAKIRDLAVDWDENDPSWQEVQHSAEVEQTNWEKDQAGIDLSQESDEGGFDWPGLIDLVLSKIQEHADDDDYWENTGPGEHVEDDLKKLPHWEDMLTPEEQKEIEDIVNTIASILFFIVFCGCMVCLCVFCGASCVVCTCLGDFRQDWRIKR